MSESMRSFVAGLLLCACAVFFEMVGAALLWNSLPEPVPVFAGQAAPQVMPVSSWPATFEDMDGRTYSFAEFAGKVIVLNLWATWCPPCREEMPSLERLRAIFSPDAVGVYCMSDEDPADMRMHPFVRTVGMPVYAFTSPVPDALDARMLPTTYIFDRTGRLVFAHTGIAQWDHPDVVEFINATLGSGR